jgi:prefoldin subunit 5
LQTDSVGGDLDLKLQELDQEIEHFREQNARLQEMQKDCEAALARVNGQIEGFERRKEEERKEFNLWMERERE